jgi:hypothetical protein
MRVIHRIVGYDRKTDSMKVQFNIPDHLITEAKNIAQVPTDDPDAAWSYPLTEAGTRRLANLIGVSAGPQNAGFYLEAFAE